MSQVGRCCHCIPPPRLPYNMGLFPAMPDADLMGRLPVWSILWNDYRTNPNFVQDISLMLNPIFGMDRTHPLDGILIGAPYVSYNFPPTVAEARAHINGTTSHSDIVDYFGTKFYLPVSTDPEFDILVDHLALGRDLVIHVPPLSWYLGVYNVQSGSAALDKNFSEADAAIARLNTFLNDIGSLTTAYSLFDAKFTPFVPRVPASGFLAFPKKAKNYLRIESYEQLMLNEATTASPPGTATISSSFPIDAIPYELPWTAKTYFENPFTSTYLQTTQMLECRFSSAQSYDAGTMVENQQLGGLYVYRLIAPGYLAGSEHYSVFGSGTIEVAEAIREPLSDGGTLWILPGIPQNNLGVARTERERLHWFNLLTRKLATKDKAFRRTLATEQIRPEPLFASQFDPEVGVPQVDKTGTRTNDPGLSERQIEFFHLGRVNPTNKQRAFRSGEDTLVSPSIAYETWAESSSFVFRTPDQGANPEDKLEGPFYFFLSYSEMLTADQHEMTLYREGSADTYTTRQTLTYTEAKPWIDAGIVSGFPGTGGDYFARPAFTHRQRSLAGVGATIAKQKIIGVVQSFDYQRCSLYDNVNNVREYLQAEPVIFQSSKFYVPKTKNKPVENFRLGPPGDFFIYRPLSRSYYLSEFVNIEDGEDKLDFDATRVFSLLVVFRLQDLTWGVNAGNGGFYSINNPFGSTIREGAFMDFEYQDLQ